MALASRLFSNPSSLSGRPSGQSKKAQLPHLLWGRWRGAEPHTQAAACCMSTAQIHFRVMCVGTHLHSLIREHQGKDQCSRTPAWLHMHTALLNVHTHQVWTGTGAHCPRMGLSDPGKPHQGVFQPPTIPVTPRSTQERQYRNESFKAGDGQGQAALLVPRPATLFSEPNPHPKAAASPPQQAEMLRAGSLPATCCCHLESSLGISRPCWLPAPPPAPCWLPQWEGGIWEGDC